MTDQLLEDIQKKSVLVTTNMLPLITEYIILSEKVKSLENAMQHTYPNASDELKELWKEQVELETSILDQLHKETK